VRRDDDAAQALIMEGVRSSIGFAAMDSIVFRTLEECSMSQLKAAGAAASSQVEREDSLHAQAMLLFDQSKYAEGGDQVVACEAVTTSTDSVFHCILNTCPTFSTRSRFRATLFASFLKLHSIWERTPFAPLPWTPLMV